MAEGDYKARSREGDPGERRSIFNSKVSWGAIFAGALVAIIVQVVLSMLGLAIGAYAVDPTAGVEGLGLGAALWWIVTALVSLFIGAWVAARMAAISNSFEGMMHGIIVWCVATFVGFLIITTTVGQIVSGAFGVVGQSIAVAGEAAGPQVAEMIGGDAQAQQQQGQQQQQNQQQQQQEAMEDIMAEMRQLVQEDNQNQAQAQQQQQDGGPLVQQDQQQQGQQQQDQQQGSQAQVQEMEQAVRELLQEGDISPQQRQQVVSMLEDNTQMSQQEAEQTVDNWVNTYEDAAGNGIAGMDPDQIEQQAGQIGDEVADVLATAAFWSFIALVLGAVVAGVGGSVAAPSEEEVRERNREYERSRDREVIDRRRDIDRSREHDTDRPSTFERDPNDPTYRTTSERRGQEPGRTTPGKNEPRMPGDPNPDEPRGKKGRNP